MVLERKGWKGRKSSVRLDCVQARILFGSFERLRLKSQAAARTTRYRIRVRMRQGHLRPKLDLTKPYPLDRV